MPRPYFNADAVRIPISAATKTKLQTFNTEPNKRIYSANGSGFSKNLARWHIQDTALPSNILYLAAESRNRGHPAVFPVTLPTFFIKLLCPIDGLVVDPFGGSGSKGIAAKALGRRCLVIDNQEGYCQVAEQRINQV